MRNRPVLFTVLSLIDEQLFLTRCMQDFMFGDLTKVEL